MVAGLSGVGVCLLWPGDYAHHDVGGEVGAAGGHVELPAVEMGNLEEIGKVRACAAWIWQDPAAGQG